MIKELWPGVTRSAYNEWFPLTGEIIETPEQYIDRWTEVDAWFKVFAIRAQRDINSYLSFIFSKFPIETFTNEIKEIIMEMVFLMVEHWVYNRMPIEFVVDASVSWNNGQSSFSSNAIPSLNIWDLAPSRMKIYARFIGLKQVLMDADENEIDPSKIDLKQFYTKAEIDKILLDFVNKAALDLKQNITDNAFTVTVEPKTVVNVVDWLNDNKVNLTDFIKVQEAIHEALDLKQDINDTDLETDAKTITGAINEIKNKNVDLKDYYKKEEIDTKLDDDFGYIERKKQDINDTDLETDAKTVVGAINEIKNKNVDLKDYYKKEEVDKKLEDTESKFPIAFAINALGAEIPNLKTIDKTVVGAINELKGNLNVVDDYLTTLQQNLGPALDSKQNITDSNLSTTDKTVVGAINEIYNQIEMFESTTTNQFTNYYTKIQSDAKYQLIENWVTKGTSTNAKSWSFVMTSGKKYRITYNWSGGGTDSATKLFKEFIYGGSAQLETYTETVTGIVVVGITVIGTLNTQQLNATTTGITITSKSGSGTAGIILKLEELQ